MHHGESTHKNKSPQIKNNMSTFNFSTWAEVNVDEPWADDDEEWRDVFYDMFAVYTKYGFSFGPYVVAYDEEDLANEGDGPVMYVIKWNGKYKMEDNYTEIFEEVKTVYLGNGKFVG